ncbi:acyl-CoA thioester hydrolase/BAAT C-terminal domain-containing protein [Brevundimonas sp.]|uniref:acyl-CoA thioester hydrolase/BAAT C-terminal domain-containing protein n=1 Tax=Brevundimonas sp. TaxID=1871086 RepID=UPI00286CC3CF|nr:acyl-CoA thioester hydrolase/BAAT C-terminal domain-containing protein [Brevundimonas sp.]
MSLSTPTALLATLLLACSAAAACAQTPATASASVASAAPAEEVRREDLVADYFAADPAIASRGAVIVLGGSEGGLGGSRNLARRLAADGFNAIAVSYFGEAGQSPRLNEIPIEPVGAALVWLQTRLEATGPVAIVGVSKGAELALVAASRDPRIKAVAVGVPSHLVWQGIDQTGGATGSSWTVGGQPLPHTPYDFSRGFISIFALYAGAMDAAPAEAEIPVERIAGPVLMISGQADTLWPSADMAARIERRLQAHDFAFPVVNLAYPEAGHAVFGPPIRDPNAPALQTVLSVGGTIPALVSARADGWPRVLAFLREALSH